MTHLHSRLSTAIFAIFLILALMLAISACNATLVLPPDTTPQPPNTNNQADVNPKSRAGQFKVYTTFAASPLPSDIVMPTPTGEVRVFTGETTGPATMGWLITIAGKEIQLPSDSYIAHDLIDVACVIGSDPCLEAPLYVLARGNSTIFVSIPSGIIYEEKIGEGDEAPFAFLNWASAHFSEQKRNLGSQTAS